MFVSSVGAAEQTCLTRRVCLEEQVLSEQSFSELRKAGVGKREKLTERLGPFPTMEKPMPTAKLMPPPPLVES
jgi:hypothetical protein